MSSWVSSPLTLVLGELAVCTAVVTVGWAFQPNNETDLDAKRPRGSDAWAVSIELFSFFATALYCNKLDSFAIRSE